jgi:hypothetical protein
MKTILLILSLLIFANLNAQKVNSKSGKWHYKDKPEGSDFIPLKKSGVSYRLTNDNDNIYIDLKIEDPEVQNTILRGGLIIWINMDGKSLKKMGVRYPIGSEKQPVHNKSMQIENSANQNVNQRNPLSMAYTIELIGFINETERHFPADNYDNFRGSVRFDEVGALIYKMIMPVAKLPVRNTREKNETIPFTLGIEYGFPFEMNKIVENKKSAPSLSNQSGVYHSGSAKGKKPGQGSHTESGNKMGSSGIGRNSKGNKMETGSEELWIKDIGLATSR